VSTVPAKAGPPQLSHITDTTVDVKFTNGDNGGAAINDRQIGYGTRSTSPSTFADALILDPSGNITITGLQAGLTYYFWARTHNVNGWGPWSARASIKTLHVPDAPTTPLLSSVTATTVDMSWGPNGNGGAPITEYQRSASLSGLTTANVYSVTSPHVVTRLSPGDVWFFRVRAKNSVGWSPWSGAASVRTVAGAYVKVGTAWKLAVPYVNVAGVWKPAEPWVRYVGEWKRTTN
jgi:hypothetical protein